MRLVLILIIMIFYIFRLNQLASILKEGIKNLGHGVAYGTGNGFQNIIGIVKEAWVAQSV
jgi:hypothetical protein